MKNLVLVLAVAILILSQSGCSGDNALLTWPYCDCEGQEPCEVPEGFWFTIRLEANSSAGFMWEITDEFDEEYVELINYSFRPVDPDDDREGAPMYQIWTFKTKSKGTTSASLIYKFVGDETPEKTKDIVVVIK